MSIKASDAARALVKLSWEKAGATAARAAAARENGKKGGRPRKDGKPPMRKKKVE